MKTVIGKSGIIENFFTEAELAPVLKYLSNLKSAFDYGNGLDENHPIYSWFVKKCFNKIQEVFGKDVRLARVTYLDETIPIALHSDYYQINGKGTPAFAMLIPISSDFDKTFDKKVHTVIFNEEDIFVEGTNKITRHWDRYTWDKHRVVKENNAMQIYSEHLSHMNMVDLECLTVHTIAEWKFGSIIYWDEKLLHTSDNFAKNNIKSKQALVLHTYVL
jgi:hypothetical protein